MKDVSYYLQRILFLGALIAAGLAVAEKAMNLVGYTFLGEFYSPWRFLEFAAVCLLFIVVLQLREINITLSTPKPMKETKKPD
jgi:hypothetical protein